MSNANLRKAKREKNDEFYTRYEDIAAEIGHYREYLRGKVVYCPCDDYRWSNFVKYFKDNFHTLGLKKLYASNYDIGQGAYKYSYNGKVEIYIKCNGNGDFRSDECTKIMRECDIVVTNPPFSLFREYVKQLMDYGKKFIIIGNGNAVTYKEIFPLIKENKLWLGVTKGISSKGGSMQFKVPNTYDSKFTHFEGKDKYAEIGMACWFTNIEHKKRNTPLDLYKRYSNEYPHYDNYDAIDSRTDEIPMDYDGVIGVPITFLDKYCPTQFEILGALRPILNGKALYKRILVRRVHQEPDGQK